MAQITKTIPSSAQGMRLSDWLLAEGVSFRADCGGRGTCGKCRVFVVSGGFLQQNGTPYTPDGDGFILACRAICTENPATIRFSAHSGQGLTGYSLNRQISAAILPENQRFGAAVDLGTTTLAVALVDRQTGETLETRSALNPQNRFGADVISRILACQNGHLNTLSALVRQDVAAMLASLTEKHGVSLHNLTVAGNPTMLHLFANISPEGMGAYPFTPAFTETLRMPGSALSLPAAEVILLPFASAFIGSDILGGVLAAGMADAPGSSVLIDVGTNGEMVFCGGNTLLAASTAAGPALEGANISCGMGGVAGAVNAVFRQNGRLCFTTIDDAPPLGLCGSGLISLVAVLLAQGILDETGFLEDGDFTLGSETAPVLHFKADGSLLAQVTSPVLTLTQKDIREFQLAKSAVAAGFSVLLEQAKTPPEALSAAVLAGGLGFYMNTESAFSVGLLPNSLAGRIVPAGNASLAGAIACLCSAESLAKLEDLAKRCQTIDLNHTDTFSDYFMENMLFPAEY